MKPIVLSAFPVLFALAPCVLAAEQADLIIRHATVVDVEHATTHADQAVVVRGNDIVAVGDDRSIAKAWKAPQRIDGKGRFLIFDPITNRQVVCFIGGRVEWQQVRDALGRRVAATGRIQSRRSGEKISIAASRFEVLLEDSELPSAADVLGILKVAK